MTSEGRIALVTRANRGMGLETARQLLRRGLCVAMTGRDEAATERARIGLGDGPTGGFFKDRHQIEW